MNKDETAMKIIIAYIRPERLSQVKKELFAHELYSLSVTNILGAGRQKGYTEMYRGVITEVTLLKKLRLELCVDDDKAENAMRAIAEGARTGTEGDGVIYKVAGLKGFRVRTGESL